MNFMENWDLFDENRNPLGQTHPRGIPLPEGCYHNVVFVWPADRLGRFLLMRRAPEKKTYAGCWGSTGGSVLAGESGPAGAVRELFEETGICVSEDMLELIYSVRERDMFCDIYFLPLREAHIQIRMQAGETVEAGWFLPEQIDGLADLSEPDRRRWQVLGHLLEEKARLWANKTENCP